VSHTEIVSGVIAGELCAEIALYDLVHKGQILSIARRHYPLDWEDASHDLYMALLANVRRGVLRDPEYLRTYAYSMFRRMYARYCEQRARRRADPPYLIPVDSLDYNPEQILAWTESQARDTRLLHEAIGRLSPRAHSIITMHLAGKKAAQIQVALNLTETQERLGKSRALASLAVDCRSAGQQAALLKLSRN
jgi:RNA polymerase sigma factor (sigma-70 family)